jgi:hypothetical protein
MTGPDDLIRLRHRLAGRPHLPGQLDGHRPLP